MPFRPEIVRKKLLEIDQTVGRLRSWMPISLERLEEVSGEISSGRDLKTSKVRERVLERAGHQCQFRSPDWTRCSSRTGLEIEHERPFTIYRSLGRITPALR